jgi:hypothetical protein
MRLQLETQFCKKYYFRNSCIHLEFGLNTSNVLRSINYIMIKVAEQVVITEVTKMNSRGFSKIDTDYR